MCDWITSRKDATRFDTHKGAREFRDRIKAHGTWHDLNLRIFRVTKRVARDVRRKEILSRLRLALTSVLVILDDL